jgi:CBS-domain-containing membrane protein
MSDLVELFCLPLVGFGLLHQLHEVTHTNTQTKTHTHTHTHTQVTGPRGLPVLMPPAGALAVLLFATPTAPLAQPRNVLLGTALSAALATLLNQVRVVALLLHCFYAVVTLL